MRKKYKKMVDKMLQIEEESGGPNGEELWFLYILRCEDNTFYTGITKDIERRLKMHNAGKASKYTRVRRPLKLIYRERLDSRAQALSREYKVKKMSRQAKEKLILKDEGE